MDIFIRPGTIMDIEANDLLLFARIVETGSFANGPTRRALVKCRAWPLAGSDTELTPAAYPQTDGDGIWRQPAQFMRFRGVADEGRARRGTVSGMVTPAHLDAGRPG
jgi:hypothetical protein